jgi:predicted RNA polymerase sigma factor
VAGTEEALLAAAMQWPKDGVPDNPKGWLITVASRRLTDLDGVSVRLVVASAVMYGFVGALAAHLLRGLPDRAG